MAEVLHLNWQTLSIFERFGIALGFGEHTVKDVCELHQVNPDFFIEVVNVCNNKDYFPKDQLHLFNITQIIAYLKKSHAAYLDVKIPRIEQLIHKLEWKDEAQRKNNKVLENFFVGYKSEIVSHMAYEEATVYPYATALTEYSSNNNNNPHCDSDFKINTYAEVHDNIEEKLTDLRNIIIKYLPPPTEPLVSHQILSELFLLEKDLNEHSRIEDKILIPKIQHIERTIKDNIRK